MSLHGKKGLSFGEDFLPNAPKLGSNFLGGESDFIKGNLKSTISSGGMSKFLSQSLFTAQKALGREAESSQEVLREIGAASGFKGANANLVGDLFAEEAGRSAELEVGFGGIADTARTNALGQLIGVNQEEARQQLSVARLQEIARQFDITSEEGRRQFEKEFGLKERELDARLDAMGGDFLSVIGSILGGGAGIILGGAFAGVGSSIGSELGGIFSGFFNPNKDPNKGGTG